MKQKAFNFLKTIYVRLLRFDFVWKRRNAIRRFMKKRRRAALEKYIDRIMSHYGNLRLEDTGFQEVTLEKGPQENVIFGYDIIGQFQNLDKCDYIEYCSNLGAILDNDTINMKLAYINNPEGHEEALQYFQDKMKLYTVTENQGYIVNCGDFRAAFLGVTSVREGDEGDDVLSEEVLKNIVYARQQGIQYIVAYVDREAHKSKTTTPHEKAIVRQLANLGCQAIFCSNPSGFHVGGNIQRMDSGYTHCLSSMGTVFGDSDEMNAASVAIRFKLVPIDEEGGTTTNKGYIPLYNTKSEDGKIESVIRIDYHNGEHRRNKAMMDALAYIEDESGKMRDIRNILTIQDICDILKVELPEKYKALGNASVGKVCARSFEIASGDVLFFREPFQDPNDGEPKPLELRMRIVEKALNRGARFVFSFTDLDESIPHVKVENCREAHITVCAHLREMYEVRTIGITGSVGKTSTKDMLYNVLNEKYATYRNLRNSNTQVNIGMHIQEFRGGYEFFIQEIGGGRPGGASRHARMILPEATIITNIGHAHIGNYGSQEAIMHSKLGIIEGMDNKGTVFLNGDDPLLWTAKPNADTVFYGVENKDADYYAEDIREDNGKTYFTIVHGEERVPAMLNVLGHYNVLNAVCCFAIGKKFGLKNEEIVSGISKFETSGVRQNLISVAGYNLFVDCFNASPASMDSSLSVLDKIETEHQKIAVLGDVTGAAELSREIHEEIGDIVKQHQMDILVCYGEEQKIVYDIAKAAGYNAVHFTEPGALEGFIKKTAKPGDVILFKGSSKMLLAERIDSMFGSMLSDQRYIDGVKFKKAKYNKVTYNLYPDYATVVGCVDFNGTVKVTKSLRGRPVYNLGEGAFSDKENITNVVIPNQIRHIGAGCFHGCGMIEKMKLPKQLKFIDDRAFAECNVLQKLILPEGVLHLGSEVFDGCSELTEVYLPATITEMGDNVFANCDNLTVHCKKDSYAAAYCEENGVQYKLV